MYFNGVHNMHAKWFLARKGDRLEQVKLYIYAKKIEYGEKLMRYIAGQQNPYIEVELLTKLREKTEFKQDDFVISDDIGSISDLECNTVQIVKRPEEETEGKIFMYQSREMVYQKLLAWMGVGKWKKEDRKNTDTRLICVFSPGGGDERTHLAFHRALESAQREKVLYISLCEFPIFAGEESGEKAGVETAGLSDLILCAKSSAFDEKLEELAVSTGPIWMIAPAGHYKDLLDYPSQEMVLFAQRMKQQSIFDVVIVEVGQLFEYTLEFLASADEVIVPEEKGFFAEARKRVLEQYCIREGQRELWEHLRFVNETSYKRESEEIRRLLYGEEGAYDKKRRPGAKGTDTAYGAGTGAGGLRS